MRRLLFLTAVLLFLFALPARAQTIPTPPPTAVGNYVTARDIYVRGGPGEFYLPVGRLVEGAAVVPLNISADGRWILIQYSRGFGWIRRDLADWADDIDALPQLDESELTPTSLASDTPTPRPTGVQVVAGEAGAYVRFGPGVNFPYLGAIVSGEFVDPVGRNLEGDWILIRFRDGFGWVSRALLARNVPLGDLPVLLPGALTPSATSPASLTPMPSDTPTITQTSSPTLTATLIPTNTPVEPATLTATASVTLTETTPPTETLLPSETPTLLPTNTLTPSATVTLVPTQTPSLTETATSTPTESSTATATPAATDTATQTETATRTSTSTATLLPSLTPTDEINLLMTSEVDAPEAATRRLIVTMTFTAIPTRTDTPTNTLTPSPAATDTPSETPTASPTATNTPSEIPTTSPTATDTPSETPTATATEMATETRTPRPIVAVPTETAVTTAEVTEVITETRTPRPPRALSATQTEASATEESLPTAEAAESLVETAVALVPDVTEAVTPEVSETVSLMPSPTETATATRTPAVAVILPTPVSSLPETTTTPSIPPEAFVGIALLLALIVYIVIYWRGLSVADRYANGFVIERCPVCQQGHLSVETRQNRVLGIPRPRSTVRCDTCRSVLREVGSRRWRYAVDPAENPPVYSRFNGKIVDEATLIALMGHSHTETPPVHPPAKPPIFLDDEE